MIEEILERGQPNKKTFEELQILTGCKDSRRLRKIIAAERKAGAIILSSPHGGYWLPEDIEEVERYVSTMTKEAKSIFKAVQPARRYIKAVRGGENGRN